MGIPGQAGPEPARGFPFAAPGQSILGTSTKQEAPAMSVSHQTIRLDRGKHAAPEDGACVMELASMLAGESFTDRPQTVCPVVAGFLRGYNDLVDDARRQELYRYAAEVVGTAGDRRTRRRRRRLLRRWARRAAERRSPALALRTGFRVGSGDEIGGHV